MESGISDICSSLKSLKIKFLKAYEQVKPLEQRTKDTVSLKNDSLLISLNRLTLLP